MTPPPGLRGKIGLAAGGAVIIALAAATAVYLSVGATQDVVSRGPSVSLADSASSQIVLPFNNLEDPQAVAVDTAGDVYVIDSDDIAQVLKLAAGSTTPTGLPVGLDDPDPVDPIAIAVDTGGALYVADFGYGRVLKLAGGSATKQTALPFTFSDHFLPITVAVDTAGAVYVGVVDVDNDKHMAQVRKLAAGSTVQNTLLHNLTDVCNGGVAVDDSSNLYVNTSDGVLKLAEGSTTPTKLPFNDLDLDSSCAGGLAVDTAGNVYVADYGNNRVLKLAAGSTTPTVLPFTGLDSPMGVAVDTAGAVYVVDGGNTRVLKLPAH
jgi:sugar lactone lactonase YvrE